MQSLLKCNLSPSLVNLFIDCDENHRSTQHHREPLLTHLHMCGTMCDELADTFGVPHEVAYWVGFLHDIGKPLTRKCVYHKKENTLQRIIFTGHAQVGACLATHILRNCAPLLVPEQYIESVLFCIDNHMCCCRETTNENNYTFQSYLTMMCPPHAKELTIRMLCMLFAADSLSRICDNPPDKETLVQEMLAKMRQLLSYTADIPRRRVIIMLLGYSGSGKTTACERMKREFDTQGAAHVERDQCTMKIAQSINPQAITYEDAQQIIAENDAKKQVQQLWIQSLCEALEDKSKQIVLIDSVQMMYPHAWNATVSAFTEEAKEEFLSSLKIGLYCIPQAQLGVQFVSKIGVGKYTSYPPTDATSFFPSINMELGKEHAFHLDIGTGRLDGLIEWIPRFLRESSILSRSVQPQYSMIELVRKYKSVEKVVSLFPEGCLEIHDEFDNEHIRIQTVSYRDGTQTFVGPTRDYRGETLMMLKKRRNDEGSDARDDGEGEWHLLRGCLPVFPDYCSIDKDPKAAPFTREDAPSEGSKFAMTYKYDGSLMNITYIPQNSHLYPHIVSVLPHVNWLYMYGQSGVFMFGSKGRVCADIKNVVRKRFIRAIKGTYGTMDEMGQMLEEYLTKWCQKSSTITFHFEAIDMLYSAELTVQYDRAFCPFFGVTTVDEDGHKTFSLPVGESNLRDTTPIIWCDSWEEVLRTFHANYEKLLEGDAHIEPEGCVVHVFSADKAWHPIKLKYDFYYVAHKPNKPRNVQHATEIREHEKYVHLRKRLQKFRKISPEVVFDGGWDEELFKPYPQESRKEYAKRMLSDENRAKIAAMEENIKKHGICVKNLLKHVFDAYEHGGLTIERFMKSQ